MTVWLITPLKNKGNVVTSVCPFVCLSVCLQDNSKVMNRSWWIFFCKMDPDTNLGSFFKDSSGRARYARKWLESGSASHFISWPSVTVLHIPWQCSTFRESVSHFLSWLSVTVLHISSAGRPWQCFTFRDSASHCIRRLSVTVFHISPAGSQSTTAAGPGCGCRPRPVTAQCRWHQTWQQHTSRPTHSRLYTGPVST